MPAEPGDHTWHTESRCRSRVLRSAILAHPFLTELAEGSLDEACFKFYIVQGALYLR